MRVVDPADRRPDLVLGDEGPRKRRGLPAVGVRPLVAGHFLRGVRGVLQDVVDRIRPPGRDVLDLVPDRQHRVAEAVELLQRLALGGLDHQRAGNRERHRRRVEAVVHQTLGDVLRGDAGPRLQRPQVEDQFVGDASVPARVEHVVARFEARLDVVGVQDGVLGGRGHPAGAQQANVGVRDEQDARAAPRGGGDRRNRRVRRPVLPERMPRKVRRQVPGDGDRAHAGSAPAVRDGERLVQVEVADVGADARRGGEPDLGVEVGAVQVHLPALFVDDAANLLDGVLEDAVRRRIGDHQRAQPAPVPRRLGPQVRQIDVAVAVAGHDHRLQAGHDRAGRIGAVGGGRNQHHVALALAAGALERPDHEQPGELPLRAGVGLQGDGVEAGDGAQQRFELGDDGSVPARLRGRREGMHVPELRPGDRLHLRGGVELHRARAEGDHRRVEADVLALEPLQVAHHLQLGAMPVEDRVGQERRGAPQRFRPGRGRQRLVGGGAGAGRGAGGAREHLRDRVHVGAGRRLVEGDADVAARVIAEVDPRGLRRRPHRGGESRLARRDAQRVEERVVALDDAERFQPGGQQARQPVRPPGDRPQPVRTVIRGVHARDVGQQRLRGADVRRGALAPDVLLAGLEGHAVRPAPPRVHRHADHPPRHLPGAGAAGREERGVRPAAARRHAEALRAADHHVGAHLARRGRQRQGEQIGGRDHERPRRVRPGRHRTQIEQAAERVGRLRQHPEQIVRAAAALRRGAQVGHVDPDAERLRAPAHHRDGLGKAVRGDQEAPRLGTPPGLQPEQHRHRLGRGRRFVEQGRVGDLHPRQIRDGGLEVQQRLQAALRDLGLVRRVRGVPAGVLEQVAADHRGRHAAVVAETDERPPPLVAGGQRAHPRQELRLRFGGGQVEGRREADARRDRLVQQGVERRRPDHREHAVEIRRARSDVPVREAGRRVHHAGFSRLRRRARRRPPRPAARPRRRDRRAPARSSRPRADPGSPPRAGRPASG